MRGRLLGLIEVPCLVAVPATMLACAALDVDAAAGLTAAVAALAVVVLAAQVEATGPRLGQVMLVVVLGAVAAAGRIAFAAIPDVKPVSAVCIIAGATLGRRSGFATGAIAALASNAYFGQGLWTPWQMYAWGLIGYLSGALFSQQGDAPRWLMLVWGVASGLLYGLILNGWYVVGYVRPLTWAGALSAFALGIPYDVLHGLATAAFLLVLWVPWRSAIRRAVVKHGLGED